MNYQEYVRKLNHLRKSYHSSDMQWMEYLSAHGELDAEYKQARDKVEETIAEAAKQPMQVHFKDHQMSIDDLISRSNEA